jgi:lysosomal acid lipase/cholesteryl ester hydrolase
VRTGELQKFDYGARKNLEIYGSRDPPKYDVTKFSVPFAMFHGTHEKFMVGPDYERFLREIKHKLVLAHEQPGYCILICQLETHINTIYFFRRYTHMDFVWGKDAHVEVYPLIIDLVHQFHNNHNFSTST